jgi:uridine kinase
MNGNVMPGHGLLIGIGGVSRSGKTTLATMISGLLTGHEAEIICQDDYIQPLKEIPEINGHIDWEDPASIDFSKIRQAVAMAFTLNRLVILEGLFAFHDPDLNRQMRLGFFIHLPRRVFMNRKRMDLRWGAEPEWYIRHIWRSYQQYGRNSQEIKHLIRLDGRRPFDLEGIAHHIREIL